MMGVSPQSSATICSQTKAAWAKLNVPKQRQAGRSSIRARTIA